MCIRDSFRTEIRLIASDYRYDLLNVLPDDLFQHDSPDIVSAALVLVDSMGGADEEVLSLFKIAGGRVVELLLAVVAMPDIMFFQSAVIKRIRHKQNVRMLRK